jgi:hypothetical protein
MKKIISAVLTIALMVTCAIPAMAAESTDKELENAIRSAKAKIAVPADCSKFSYYINTQNDNKKVWSLSWNSTNYSKSVSVSIDSTGFISSFYSYTSYDYEKKLPKYTKEQGQKIAETFINKINPGLISKYKLVPNINQYYDSNSYNYTYIRQVNGIPFNRDSINISVNNKTSEINNFNCQYSDLVFPSASKAINTEAAQKAFTDKLGLKLVYLSKQENDKISTYLAYIPKDTNKYIDAETGEVKDNYYMYGPYYGTAGAELKSMANSNAVASNLSPEEVEAVKNVSNLISKEDADKKVRALSFLNMDEGFTLNRFELSRDWRDPKGVLWNLGYSKPNKDNPNITRSVDVTMDAKTGEIVSFWTYYTPDKDAKAKLTREQARAAIDESLKTVLGSKYSKVKYDSSYYDYYAQMGKTPNDPLDSYTFRYNRVENGIEFPNNAVTVNYDNLTGNITNVSRDWNNDLTFVDPKNVIPLTQANETLFSQIGYGLGYSTEYPSEYDLKFGTDPSKKAKVILGYFINSNMPQIISAINGKVLNSDGSEYKVLATSDYKDIKGNRYENQIKLLTQMNVRYVEDLLKSNENVKQQDYFILLSKLTDVYYFDINSFISDKKKNVDNMYETLISMKIISANDKRPDATVTREEAAKYLVDFLRMNKVASIKDIFVCKFKDANKISPDKVGDVCIATGLKAMNGIGGNFNPKALVTRDEALMIVYNFLQNQ